TRDRAARGASALETTGHVRPQRRPPPCLVPDKLAGVTDGALAPRYDHAFGDLEMLLDILVPVGPAADVDVPPDREAVGLQCLDQRPQPGSIFRLVRDEHIRGWTCHRGPNECVDQTLLGQGR